MEASDLKKRLEIIEFDAKAKTAEIKSDVARNATWYNNRVNVPNAPIIIASSEGVGTRRVRANHPEAFIDFFEEQEKLKKAGASV